MGVEEKREGASTVPTNKTTRPDPLPGSKKQLEGGSPIRAIINWVYGKPKIFPLATDLAIWPIGLLVGAVLKLVFDVPMAAVPLVVSTVAAVALHTFLGLVTGLYRGRWRIASFLEASTLGTVWLGTSIVLIVANFYARSLGSSLPTSAVITGCLATLGILMLERISWRRYWEANRRPDPVNCKPTIVFGAGEGGSQMVRAMLVDRQSEYFPVALLDDDPNKSQREIDGVRVQGTRYHLEEVAEETGAEVLLVAVTEADSELITSLSKMAANIGLDLRVLPPASELVGKMTLADVRPPTVDDLLGRDPVEIDLEAVAGYIRGRRVLVTGAGGSIGSELSKQLYGFAPSELYLLDRDENALHGVQLELEGRALLDSDMLIVADIRDRERVFEVFDAVRPEVVFHAAALKHLTLLENHPAEGVKTNAIGTKNLLDAAVKIDVDRFVNISTDKAADPTSVLGASKLAAEKLTALVATETGRPYESVRFGNVLGSRGSVLPTFLGQIEQGKPITVTHPDVTRFFMTIPEAVRLVLQAGAIGRPGEIMILDMGEPVKIVDVARRLIEQSSKDIDIVYTGLREGEKMHEVLVGVAECGETREHDRISHTMGSTELNVMSEIVLNEPGQSAVLRCASELNGDELASSAA